MPFVRCRFYTESGEPVRGGCHRKGAGCAFVHPDDPDWNNAPPPRPRERGGDAGGFKPRGGKRSNVGPLGRDAGGNADTNSTDFLSGWGDVSGWGGGGSGGGGGGDGGGGGGWGNSGWGNGSGWDAGSSVSTAPAPVQSNSPSAMTPQEMTTLVNERNQADATLPSSANTKNKETGWGIKDNTTASGPGNTGSDAWGTSSWGNTKDADKDPGSGWGNNGWGSGWGDNKTKDATNDTTKDKTKDTTKDMTKDTTNSDTGWGGAGSGWGSSWGSDKDTAKDTTNSGSAWGGTASGGRGSSWGSNKDTTKDTTGSDSGWGGAGDGWGNKRDPIKDASNSTSGWGGTGSGGWGSDWGGNKDTTNSRGVPDSMAVDNQPEETGQNKRKSRTLPAPPRIRIPDTENKRNKITGTNNEPLGSSKWGVSRSSNLVTTSTPATTSTPLTSLTPTDSSRLKRKRDAHDDKIDTFKEYIKTWERAVRTRFLLAEAETKRDRWFRTQKSACYARIGEAGRKRLDGERAECDKEVNLQKDKLSCAITALVSFHDTISSSLDLGQRYDIGEQAGKFIEESKAFVDEVRTLLVEHVLKDKHDAQTDDNPKHTPETDSNVSLINLQSQVRDLEERFDHAQTLLTLRHDRDIRCDVDELLTTKITTLREARQGEIDRVASQPRPDIVIPPDVLEKIEGTAKQVGELDAMIPKTVEDIRVLLLRVDATTKRVTQLEQELSVNKATYSKQVQEMAAEKQQTEQRLDERFEKIQEQFEQLVASHSPGPAEQAAVSSTICNPQDKLMDDLRPSFETLLDEFYKREVLPTLDSLRQVVIQASDRHQEDAIKVLWGKIQPAMNMVAGVSRWLDSQELGLTAPAEADVRLSSLE